MDQIQGGPCVEKRAPKKQFDFGSFVYPSNESQNGSGAKEAENWPICDIFHAPNKREKEQTIKEFLDDLYSSDGLHTIDFPVTTLKTSIE